MINIWKATVRGMLALTLLLSAQVVRSDIHDRIEYKLNRVLKDVDIFINGNTGNCTPINQVVIDQGSGSYTITQAGEYCVTENVTGLIVVDADCVCIDLSCHTLSAGGAANAIVGGGHQGLKVFNGCISDSTEAGISLSNYQAVELYNLHMHDHSLDSIRQVNSTDLNMHNVAFIGNNGERAAWFDTCTNIAVDSCQMTGFRSTQGSVFQFNDCANATLQDVDISGCTKAIASSNFDADTILGVNTCTGFNLFRVKVNNNTNVSAGTNEGFACIGFLNSNSCSLHQCQTSNNTDTAGGANSFDDMLIISGSSDFIVTEHQANYNACTVPTFRFFICTAYNSNNVVFDGCQANNNFVQELVVNSTIYSLLKGFTMQQDLDQENPFIENNIIRNCQANFNTVANGGAGRNPMVGNASVVIGICLEGSGIIDNCQANNNVMGGSFPETYCTGVQSVFSRNVTISNTVSDFNTGGVAGSGFNIAPLAPIGHVGTFDTGGYNHTMSNCTANSNAAAGLTIGVPVDLDVIAGNISILDCVFNENGNNTYEAAGIKVFPFTNSISNLVIKGCQINSTFSGVLAAGINLGIATNVVIEDCNIFNTFTTTPMTKGHGIILSETIDSKILRAQMHGNQDSGIELVSSNTTIAIIECVAMDNDKGFSFAATSTASCCLVQDCRALSNRTAGFEHAAAGPMTTTFIGNEAQCNGNSADDNYVISGGVINLQELEWGSGAVSQITGSGAVLGSRFVNIRAVA